MNLEQAIHQHWADNESLVALLPADQVTTGRSRSDVYPHATITRRACRTIARTNSGRLEGVELIIHIRHPTHQPLREIAQAVTAAFDRASFDLDGGRRIHGMTYRDESTEEQVDGIWETSLAFDLRHWEPT